MDRNNSINKKRDAFRAEYSGLLFNSYFNLLMVILIFGASLTYSGLNINWAPRTFVLLPLAFLYSEAVMYFTHRYQQHRKMRFHERIFEMHAIWHHGMFSNETMSVDSPRDMNMVVLPFFIHGFVLGLIYFPFGLFLHAVFETDLGWILMFSITLQLIWYETVHTIAHSENPPLLKTLALHHREHHNPKLMGKYNFGIATTIFDRLLGTRHTHR